MGLSQIPRLCVILTSKAISIKSSYALILEIWRCQNSSRLIRGSLSKFNLKNEQDGIKIHHEAATELVTAAERLHGKGLITQKDGGYLTDLGRKAAEHAQDLLIILK